jgi:hypothetical protein
MSGKRGGIVGVCLCVALALCASVAAPAWGAGVDGYAWGGGFGAGELGNGTFAGSVLPVKISGLTEVVGLAGGTEYGLALSAEGTVTAWGENNVGQLGNGSNKSSDVPVAVSALSEVTAIAAGAKHGLALLGNGTVEAWGNNAKGQLGNGTTSSSDVPVAVSGLSEVTAIAAGGEHSLALLANGTVEAWGGNIDGQLGNGTTSSSDVPVAVSGLSEVTAIAAGQFFSLALLRDGEVRSWGRDSFGELGDDGHCGCTQSTVPTAVNVSEVAAIAAGYNHSLALLDSGTVEAWGENKLGALGDGTVSGSDTPVAVSGLTEVSAVAAGGYHSLALLRDGAIMAWGGDELGELGNGHSGSGLDSTTAVAVSCQLEAISGIAAGFYTGLAWGGPGEACPTIEGVKPFRGSATEATPVTIIGTGFTDVESVKLGEEPVSFTVESPTAIHITAPAGVGKVVEITVTTARGTSEPHRFSYEAPPEFGRCLNVGPHADGDAPGCFASGGADTDFEWFPAFGSTRPVEKPHFTLSSSSLKVETVGKAQITCDAAAGAGEFTGDKTATVGQLTLSGCSEKKAGTCQSAAAKEGEVRVGALDALIGRFQAKADRERVGIELSPSSGEIVAEFSCAGQPVTLRGSVILEVADTEKGIASNKWKAIESKGVQFPTSFEGGPEVTLQAKIGSAGYQAAALKGQIDQTDEEKIEVNNSATPEF